MYVTAQTDVYLNGTVWGDQICHVTHRIGDVCVYRTRNVHYESSICERDCWIRAPRRTDM